jgi:muramoyltetrapeptide carboxypeptidase LdcA involved in peptidoglycan recycling
VSLLLLLLVNDDAIEIINQLINAVDVLKDLNVPILIDVDLGHLPPTMPIITGSVGVVNYKDNDFTIEMLLK